MRGNSKILNALRRELGPEMAKKTLENFSKNKQFADAVRTPLGQELLNDVMDGIAKIIGRVFEEKDTERDRAVLKAYREIITKWSKKIADADKRVKQIQEMEEQDG